MFRGTVCLVVCIISLFFVTTTYSAITKTIEDAEISVSTAGDYAEFEGTPVYGEPGEPVLPQRTYTLLVPPDADLASVTASVTGLQQAILSGTYAVKPGSPLAIQGEVIWPEGKTIIDGKDVAIYSQDAYFPSSHVTISTAGMMRHYKIVQVAVHPILYNPVTGKLKKMTAGTLRLDYARQPGAFLSRNTVKMPRGMTKMAAKIADNYHEMAGAYAELQGTRNGGLAIITTDAIESGSQQLSAYISHKEMRGYTVTVETQSSWSTSQIRSWIKSNYESLNIEHLLLIGDPTPSGGDVPMYKSGSTPTDWYYAELSGSGISSSDVTAEVHVGRIPVYHSSDIQKLDHILDKTMLYENTPEEEISWRFKVLLSMKPIDSRTQAYELGEQIKDSTLIRCDWDYYRVYDKDYNLSPPPELTPVTSSNTQQAWKNEQPGCVFWDTHGSPTSSSGMISVSQVGDLDDTHPVFTFQGACLNARPDVDDNLCYSLLQHGAIATNGGTISVSYSPGESDYTNTGSIGGQNYWYAEALIRDSLTTAAANDYARVKINGKKWANHCALVLYGDPTVSPYSCEINTNPYIRVNVPNGGEEWEQYSTQDIRWSDNIQGNVKIELMQNGSAKEVLAASVASIGSWSWEIPENYPLGDNYKVRVTSIDSSALWEESDEVFSIVPELLIALPYKQPFTDWVGVVREMAPWEQMRDDDMDWTIISGPTPSRTGSSPDETGAESDHTGNNGQYIYTEASGSNNNKSTSLLSPKFDFRWLNDPKLTVWYHMFSQQNTMGNFYIDVKVDQNAWQEGIIQISGDQGDSWKEKTIDIGTITQKNKRVRFRLRGITGDDWCSDICIDDFEVHGTGVDITAKYNSRNDFSLTYCNARINYRIPKQVNKENMVSIDLYNAQGKLVKTLVHGVKKTGNYSINLANKTYRTASGVYLVKMEVDNFSRTVKIIHK